MSPNGSYRIWSGPEWQQYVLLLLKTHYGPASFQEIPDKDRGDCGLEGFSRNGDGAAYQCYCHDEPLSIADVTTKQKTKVTRDLKKLKDNGMALQAVLGGVKIDRWILVVPRFDSKELLAHTTKKAAEIRKAALPYVTTTFQIQVIKDDHFAVERAVLFDSGAKKINYQVNDPPDADVQAWAGSNDPLVQKLDQKIGRLKTVPAVSRTPVREQFLRHYVTGQNLVEQLRVDHPEIHARLLTCQKNRERYLVTASLLTSAESPLILQKVISDYQSELDREVKGLSDSNTECLAHGTVADWLLRCPLDFPEA